MNDVAELLKVVGGIKHSDSNFTNIKILVRWVGVYKFLVYSRLSIY